MILYMHTTFLMINIFNVWSDFDLSDVSVEIKQLLPTLLVVLGRADPSDFVYVIIFTIVRMLRT